jgi:uncharacterized membrane protein
VKRVDRQPRVASVDALRGLGMIIMALDHTEISSTPMRCSISLKT